MSGETSATKAATVPKLELNDGNQIPVLGLGTWKSVAGEVYRAVCDAIEIGYRHIDCALAYENEAEIGKAISDCISTGLVKREELFITSKCWNTYRSVEKRAEGLHKTLTDLKLDYVDLYLIHWPFSWQEGENLFPQDKDGNYLTTDVDYVDVWKSLEEFQKAGKVRSIGVSNFNRSQIERLLKECTVTPVMNQVESHAYLQQEKLLSYCESKGIKLTAYCPLGGPYRDFKYEGPILLENPTVKLIADSHKKAPAQILLRFLVQRGLVVIPKSISKERILNNFEIFDFELSPQQMKDLRAIDKGYRLVAMIPMKDHQYFPFGTDH